MVHRSALVQGDRVPQQLEALAQVRAALQGGRHEGRRRSLPPPPLPL